MKFSKQLESFQKAVLGSQEYNHMLSPPPKGDVITRLSVYQEGYLLRLLDVLSDDYSALRKLIGKEKFDEYALSYIKQTPSTSFSLDEYGADYFQFLIDNYGENSLSELTKFERILVELNHCAADQSLSVSELAEVPLDDWPKLRFNVQDHLRIIDFNFNVVDVFEGTERVLKKEPLKVLFWQKDKSAYYQKLDAVDDLVIQLLRDGASFSMVCLELCELVGEDDGPMVAANLIKELVNNHLLIGFSAR